MRFLTTLIFCFNCVAATAQQVEWVTDTIYGKPISDVYGTVFLLTGEESSIFIKKSSLDTFPGVSAIAPTKGGWGSGFLELAFEIDERVYFAQQDNSLLPAAGLPIQLKNVKNQSLYREDNTVAFTIADSVFIASLTTGKIDFVREGGRAMLENENQLWIKDYNDKLYFYHPTQQVLKEYPPERMYHAGEHRSIILSRVTDDDFNASYAMLDFDFNEIVNYDAGYTTSFVLDDMIILTNKRNKTLLARSPTDTTLLRNVREVNFLFNSDICVAYGTDKNIYLINRQGKRINDLNFSEVWHGIATTGVEARRGSTAYLFSPEGKELIRGNYDRIRYLYDNCYAVTKDGQAAVVDSTNNVLIPYRREKFLNFLNLGPIQEELIFTEEGDEVTVYNKRGEALISWNREDESTFVDNGAMQWAYGLEAIAAISNEQARQLNSVNAWRIYRGNGKNKEFRLIRRDGTPITHWYAYVAPTEQPELFAVRTMSGKLGLIRVRADY